MMRPWPLPLPVDIHILDDLADKQSNDSLRESDAPTVHLSSFCRGCFWNSGLSIGLLYAPAPGEDTREILSAIFDEHETTFNELHELFELFDRSRQALGDAVDAVTETVNAAGTPDPDE